MNAAEILGYIEEIRDALIKQSQIELRKQEAPENVQAPQES
jgi:hypothetical protein